MKKVQVLKQFTPGMMALVAMASCTLWSPAAHAQNDSTKPLAVVALSGYDGLMSDIDFIGSLGGMPQASQFVEMSVMQMTQQQGLVGMDKSKPLGLMVQTDGAGTFSGAVCLPISDLDGFLQVMAPFGVTGSDLGEGITQISAAGQTMFAKSQANWVYLSMMPHMLEGLPADPTATLQALTKDYDVAVQLHVQNIPVAFREMAINAMSSGASDAMERLPNESDEDFAARQQQLQAQLEELKRVFNEMDELTLGLAIDEQQQRLLMDMTMTAAPDTKLADDMQRNANPTTNYAGFLQPEAAMMLSFSSEMSPADAAQINQMLGTVRTQAARAIEEEADLPTAEAKAKMTEAINDMIDALEATIEAGAIDGGAVLNMGAESMTFVAGGFVGEPSKIETGLKKIVELAQNDPEFPGVTWDATTHAGVSFHTISAPVQDDEPEARKLFGDTVEIAVGIGEKSVYFALGRDCVEAAKAIIDTSQANAGQTVAPMEMTFALTQIMEFAAGVAEGPEQQQIASVADMLKNETSGRDHVRITSKAIPNGNRTRIEAEEGVLRAIGMAIMQAQMAGAGNF